MLKVMLIFQMKISGKFSVGLFFEQYNATEFLINVNPAQHWRFSFSCRLQGSKET